MSKRPTSESGNPDDNRNANGKFKKGHTGNPRGRPKKRVHRINSVEDYRGAYLRQCLKKININIKGEMSEVTLVEGVIYQALSLAAKGDKQMIKFVLKEFLKHANDFDVRKSEYFDSFHNARDLFFEKYKEFFEDSDVKPPEEQIEKINLLIHGMNVFEPKIFEKMDGSDD